MNSHAQSSEKKKEGEMNQPRIGVIKQRNCRAGVNNPNPKKEYSETQTMKKQPDNSSELSSVCV